MTQNEIPKDETEPVIIPQISDEEADKIIAGFNQQFEQKVMKNLKSPPMTITEPISIANVVPEQSEVLGQKADEGADLQNYLATIKSDRPNVPFADQDSGMDLSKLLAKRKDV